MKALAIATIILAFVVLEPANVKACVCVSTKPCEAFGGASAIFVGIMLEGTEKFGSEPSGDKRSREAGMVRFDVEETFKGRLGTEVTLSVQSNKDTSCAYSLIRGERYLVYVYGEPGQMSTGVCTRTNLLSEAAEDLAFLRSLPPPGTGGRILGSVWADNGQERPTPIRNLTVTIRAVDKAEKVIKVITTDEGEFEVGNLDPGQYRIQPEWPDGLVVERPMQEVIVSDRGCTSVGFWGKSKKRVESRVEGRVLDYNGRPASLMLHLEPNELARRSIIGHSNEKEGGRFEISELSPGSYRLYFEFQTEGWKSNKKYYYPGVTDRKEATVIKVALGEKTQPIDFRIPPEFSVRTIEGWVAWPDGSPAAKAEVMLLCPKSTRPDGYTLEFGPPTVTTDGIGRFRLQGFKGTNYWLEARASRFIGSDKRVKVHSPGRPITLLDDSMNVKLVLSEEGFSASCSKSAKRQ